MKSIALFVALLLLVYGCEDLRNEDDYMNLDLEKQAPSETAFEYAETNGIPICPYCQKPTKRTGGSGMSTLAYYTPVYDEHGTNINPDRNTITFDWQCCDCGNSYTTHGNAVDGYCYGVIGQ